MNNSTNYTILELIDYFKNKYSKTQIKNFCTNHHIKYKLLTSKQRGVIIGENNKSRSYKRTNINKDYFKQWSVNMAYIFGLWCADGNISKSSGGYYFSIKLKNDDRYLLENILNEMKSSHKIYDDNDNSSKICFSCKEIYYDIIKLGGVENKSLIMKFPKIPKKYISDFIRGYFDGDGSINTRNTGYLIGTYEFCSKLKEILNSNGISESSIKQKHPERGIDNNCYCLNIFKQFEFSKFEKFVYHNVDENSIILKRKDVRLFYNIN